MARLNADVPDDLRRRLYHVLLDERRSFSAWLREQIIRYLEEKEGTRRKGGRGHGAKRES